MPDATKWRATSSDWRCVPSILAKSGKWTGERAGDNERRWELVRGSACDGLEPVKMQLSEVVGHIPISQAHA